MTDYSRELNKGMKVFSQLYVGLKDQSKGQPHLGFATPLEKGSAFEKRKETILRWLGNRNPIIENGRYKTDEHGNIVYDERPANVKVVENGPRTGFKITDDVKRVYWGGGNVVWRVCDPEGFELEIQSQNLMAIIQVAGVNEGGLIPGKCVWGRSGKDNILLHEGSEEYKNAILAAETLKKPKGVGANERVLGAKYLLQDGDTGFYLGKFWVTTEENDISKEYAGSTQVGMSHVLVAEHVSTINAPEQFEAILFGDRKDPAKGYIKFYKKAPLVRLTNDSDEFENGNFDSVAAQCVIDTCENRTFASSSKNGNIVYVSITKYEKFKWVAVLLTRAEFDYKFKEFQRNISYRFNKNQAMNAIELNFFYGSTKKLGVAVGGDLFSGEISTRTFHSVEVEGALGAVQLEGSILKRYFNGHYSYNSRNSDRPCSITFKGWWLPKFSDKEGVFTWCKSLYDEGKLIKFVVRPDVY